MYNIPHFKAENELEVMDFMKAHPFITLCGIDANNEPVATHVPVLFEERNGKIFLRAHIMRKQTHTEAFLQNPNVLAIFSSTHAYVSASWYTTKNIASTWNYSAVHAKGIVQFLDDAGLYQLLTDLTAYFENEPNSPAQVKHMDEKYVRDNMKAIIAFEIELTQIAHVFKLSQNRDKASHDNIVANLSAGSADEKQVAETMKTVKKIIL